jgi:hypothetical protein
MVVLTRCTVLTAALCAVATFKMPCRASGRPLMASYVFRATGEGFWSHRITGVSERAASRTMARIDEGAVRLLNRCRVHARPLDLARPKDVEHLRAVRNQVIGDDAAVTAPPDRLGADDGAYLGPTEAAQFRHPVPEAWRCRVVGVVPEARVLPEGRTEIPTTSWPSSAHHVRRAVAGRTKVR